MNCREFENIINDLVRAQSGLRLIDATSRAEGMAHAEICGLCASRLADEGALSAGLKSLAACDEGKAATASVEAALLEAFRSQPAPRIERHTPVQPKRWSRWALAAAVVFIAFGFIVYRAIRNEPRKANDALRAEAPSPQPSIKREERVVKEIVARETPRESRATPTRRGNRPRLNKPFIIDSMTTYAKDSEYATDFFPLSFGGDQKPLDRGEVIRVQMPRSALITFGLPVNIERADMPVKADLLVGEDGLARAIRFVR